MPSNREQAVPPMNNKPEMPDHLGALAQAEWNRMLTVMAEVLTEYDGPALAAYCIAYGRWKDAEQNIQKFGTVVRSKDNDKPAPNPYLAISDKAQEVMQRWLAELRCTPKSRASVKAEAGCI